MSANKSLYRSITRLAAASVLLYFGSSMVNVVIAARPGVGTGAQSPREFPSVRRGEKYSTVEGWQAVLPANGGKDALLSPVSGSGSRLRRLSASCSIRLAINLSALY